MLNPDCRHNASAGVPGKWLGHIQQGSAGTYVYAAVPAGLEIAKTFGRRVDATSVVAASMKGYLCMTSFFWKTFGGLSAACYFRHLFFGCLFPGFIYLSTKNNIHPLPWNAYALFALNTLLYPYSRFVYESVVGFILGRNVFFMNGWVFVIAKVVTMTACWALAMAIAPIGLLYLYFHHSLLEREGRE